MKGDIYKGSCMVYPKETYWYLSFDAEPLVVKGLPGVLDSRPSELTPSPGIV
jgi:hypothetical protein